MSARPDPTPDARTSHARTPDERAWQRWLDWLPTAPPSAAPVHLFRQFRAALVEDGMPREAADAELFAVQRLMRERSDGWGDMFDTIYANPTPGFRTEVNALLASTIEGRTPGRALDVGMGQGRNALHLAALGWDVTGFDVSAGGLRLAERRAAEAGLRVATQQVGIDAFDYGAERWDLVVITYEPLPLASPAFMARLRAALRPGGLLVIESYASEATSAQRRPVDIDPAALRGALDGFVVRHFEDVVTTADWGEQDVRVVRAVAERTG